MIQNWQKKYRLAVVMRGDAFAIGAGKPRMIVMDEMWLTGCGPVRASGFVAEHMSLIGRIVAGARELSLGGPLGSLLGRAARCLPQSLAQRLAGRARPTRAAASPLRSR